jgi:hypothetical protein
VRSSEAGNSNSSTENVPLNPNLSKSAEGAVFNIRRAAISNSTNWHSVSKRAFSEASQNQKLSREGEPGFDNYRAIVVRC